MQSRQCRHSRWSMRPSASIACEPQPAAQALQLLHSCLRRRPNQRKVDGIASDAPSGHRYLQNGRSTKIDMPRMPPANSVYGQERWNQPIRNVVLKGSTSASISAHPIENIETPNRPKKTPYLTHFSLSCSALGKERWKRFRPIAPPTL